MGATDLPNSLNHSPSLSTTIISISTSKLSYLSAITIQKAMIKLWPSTPMDQLTPRAGPTGQERNPFDLPIGSGSAASGSGWPTTPTGSYHPLLNAHSSHSYSHSHSGHTQAPNSSMHSAKADIITPPLGTPTLGGFPAAQPTTHLSLHAPDFNMQQPPSASRRALANKSSTASPSTSSQSATSTPAVTSSKGQIHVKLIQARGLSVRAPSARPYVVVQFEQNEFVSRDPTAETDKEVKGTATNLSRNSSSNAISALGAIGSRSAAMDASRRDKNSTNTSPASSVSSGRSGLSNGLFGRLSAHNPMWKHEVSL
jgi:hypothetical protein